MAISYVNDRIECNNEASVTLTAIYNADVAGGWGMIEKYGNTYIAKCPIYVLGSSNLYIGYTAFETLSFNYSTSPHVYALYFTATGVCRIGRESATNYSYNIGAVIDGSNISTTSLRRYYLSGDVRVDNSSLKVFSYTYVLGSTTSTAYVNKCQFIAYTYGLVTNQYTDLEDVSFTGCHYAFCPQDIRNVNNVLFANSSIGILLRIANATFRNLKFKNITTGQATFLASNTGLRNVYLIDCQVEKDELSFYKEGTLTIYNEQWQHLKSTYNFNTDSGASINVYDNQNNLIYTGTTDENGEASTELTYYKKYVKYENNTLLEAGEIDYEPFKITISKSGYETTTIEDVYVTAGQPTIIRATLAGKKYYDKPFDVKVIKDIVNIALIEEETQ